MGQRTSRSTDPVQRFSAAWLGREKLLQVAAAIADVDDRVNATALAPEAGLSAEACSKELRHLDRLGLLNEVDDDRAGVFFEPRDSCLWQSCRDLVNEIRSGKLAGTRQHIR